MAKKKAKKTVKKKAVKRKVVKKVPKRKLKKKAKTATAKRVSADGLTNKQRIFVGHYIKQGCKNATKAAERTGYGKRSAHNQGCRMMKNGEVQQEIARRVELIMRRLDIKAESTINEVGRLAFSMMTDFVRQHNGTITLVELDSLPANQRACIAELQDITDRQGGRRFKIKLHDKVASLRTLCQHFGLLKEPIPGEAAGETLRDIAATYRMLAEHGLKIPNDAVKIPGVTDDLHTDDSPSE